MAISLGGFSSGGGGASTDTLDDVTSRGATTTNAITVGGVTVGTEYSLPTLDGSENQVLQTNGTGTLSFATLDFTGGLEYKGAFNATAGTPSLLNAEKGDFYIIDTAGTIYGQTWAVGDHLLINEDMGGTITNSKIDKIDNTDTPASETVAGVIEIATNAEAGAGTATDKALVPSNISSLDLSAMDNTTSAFISLSDIPTASNSTAGILETATNAEATSASANDKILTPANLSHIDLSTFDNDAGFISNITSESLNDLSDVSFTAGAGIDNYVLTYDNATTSWGAEAVPSASPASETVAGVIEIATNAEAGAGTATDKALVPSNISSLDLSAMDNTTSGFISDITSESLNDLSDVSFTAGAGIDNYVLTYDNGTSTWGAEAIPSTSLFTTTSTTNATYDASVNEIINLKANTGGEIRVNLPSSASNGDIIILRKPSSTSSGDPAGQATKIAVYDNGGTKLRDLEMYPVLGSHILSYDGTDWTFPVTNLIYQRETGTSATVFGYRFGRSIIYADSADTTDFTVAISVGASSLLEGARQRIICRSDRNVIITSTSTDIVDPTSGGASSTLSNSVTIPAHSGMIEIWVNSQSQYVISAPLANLGTSAFLDVGTNANNIIQLDGTAKLPAVDGSQLTNLSGESPASETVAGVIEIATNAEATAGTATDKALVPSNLSSVDLSVLDNTTSAFISDITSESLNDLSDVSFTAGAGIDNYVLTYDNGTSTWGAEAAPTASAASETTAGVIEIATNAEATAGTATDKALVPSNLSSVDLSVLDNTTSAFITSGDIPTASETTAGVIEIATNAEATAGTATDKALVPSNLSSVDLSVLDNTTSAFISDITSESLNDLSDVSFTAGAGIDNYVLTYNHSTTSWGAEATTIPQPTLTSASPSANYTISTHDGIEEIYVLTPSANISVFLPAASSCGSGYKYHIKNMASGFTLTIDANSTETIDGSTTVDIANQYEALTLITDGSNWFII